MGIATKARPRHKQLGVLYWLYRALLCLLIAPILGVLIGIVGVFAGVFMGELAAAAVLALFLADIFFRMLRARKLRAIDERTSAGHWDPDFDA
jgi:hypothetical protein